MEASEKPQDKKLSPEGKDKEKNETNVVSNTPENAIGKINPSSPGNTGTTPGTDADFG